MRNCSGVCCSSPFSIPLSETLTFETHTATAGPSSEAKTGGVQAAIIVIASKQDMIFFFIRTLPFTDYDLITMVEIEQGGQGT